MSVTAGSYVKRLRKSYKLILSSALLAVLTGFLFSYAFIPKYTSQSLILVEGQKVPENMVQPVVSEDLAARMAMLQQQVMSQSNLQRVIDRVFPGKNSEEVSEIIDEIRLNMTVEPVVTDLSQASGKKEGGQSTAVPGFYVKYTTSRPREAKQICDELTNLLVNENMKSMQAAASGTSAVLSKGLEDARRQLEELGSKLASLKKSPRESVSVIEAQRKLLTIDYDSAQKNYQDLLARKSAADLTITMTNMSEGERMFVLNPASLPDSSDSPNRPLFAVVGLGIGLLFGIPFSLLHSRREEKRRSLREGLPVPAAMMKALFDYIGTQLSSSKCDDTLRRASEFIRANSLPEEAVLAWLKEAGADCDCKTLSKAEELLEETVPGYFDLPQPDGVRR